MSYIINPYSVASSSPSDPNFANVVFLWEADGANNEAGPVNDATGKTITFAGTAKLSNTQARLGTTSFFVGTGGMTTPNNSDYRLGNSSNASPFTMEFSVYEGTLTNWEIMQFWSGSEHSWWIRFDGAGQIRLLASSTGAFAFSMDVTTTGYGFTTNAWHDICIEKDSSGKVRFYRNGVMKYSTTPGDSVFFPSTNSVLQLGTEGSSSGYIDHIRLTKGVARYATDTSYTIVESAFPTN